MAFLTVLIDDHQAQASIIIKSTIEEISNPFGGNVFYGEHLLNDPVVLANVLKDIQKAAASMTRNVLDEIILIYPVHISIKSIALLNQTCKKMEYKTIRLIPQSVASMIYLCHTDSRLKNRSSHYMIFSEYNGNIEYMTCEYDAEMGGEHIIEVLSAEKYTHTPDSYKAFMLAHQGNLAILFAGQIPGSLQNEVITFYNQGIQKQQIKRKIDFYEYKKSEALYGGCFYSSKLMGFQFPMIFMDTISNDFGLQIKGNDFLTILDRFQTLPTIGQNHISTDQLSDQMLIIRCGTLNRGFEEIKIPVTDFADAKELLFSLSLDISKVNYNFTIQDSTGREKTGNLLDYVTFSSTNDASEEKTTAKTVSFEEWKKSSQAISLNPSESQILEIIESLDDLQRSILYSDQTGHTDISKGLHMVEERLLNYLKEFNVTPIEAVGKPFDIRYHSAVDHFDDPNIEENMVVSEYKRGYRRGDKILRYSEVIVAN